MIISVMRDATVSAFAVTIDELEELHDTLRQEFPEPKLTETRIEISEDGVDYDFPSFEDLRENYNFQKPVTDFRLEINSLGRSITVGKPIISLTGVQAEISTQSDSVAWCDGIISLTTMQLKKKRVMVPLAPPDSLRSVDVCSDNHSGIIRIFKVYTCRLQLGFYGATCWCLSRYCPNGFATQEDVRSYFTNPRQSTRFSHHTRNSVNHFTRPLASRCSRHHLANQIPLAQRCGVTSA